MIGRREKRQRKRSVYVRSRNRTIKPTTKQQKRKENDTYITYNSGKIPHRRLFLIVIVTIISLHVLSFLFIEPKVTLINMNISYVKCLNVPHSTVIIENKMKKKIFLIVR